MRKCWVKCIIWFVKSSIFYIDRSRKFEIYFQMPVFFSRAQRVLIYHLFKLPCVLYSFASKTDVFQGNKSLSKSVVRLLDGNSENFAYVWRKNRYFLKKTNQNCDCSWSEQMSSTDQITEIPQHVHYISELPSNVGTMRPIFRSFYTLTRFDFLN